MVETVGGWLVIKSRVPLCVIPFELRDVSNPDSTLCQDLWALFCRGRFARTESYSTSPSAAKLRYGLPY